MIFNHKLLVMTHHVKDYEDTKAVDFKTIKVNSTAFNPNALIPEKYTCDGKNINPPLDFENIPETTRSIAIIVEDTDAPSGVFSHWIIWDMPVTHHIKENHASGIQGMNDFGKHVYSGPCPPTGTHHYYFKVYALDSVLNLPIGSNKHDLEKAMGGHILAFGELVGLYNRS